MKKKSAAKSSPFAVIIQALEDLKAHNIVAIDVTQLSDVMDTLIIASGSSNRQVRAIAQHAAEEAKKNGAPAMGTEGMDDGEWALVDFGDIVLHVMQPETREFYELEKLWLIPGSSETIDLANKKPTAKPVKTKTAQPKTAVRAKTPAAKKPGTPAAAKKTPARKSATDDVMINQSDASKARRRNATTTTASKKIAPKTTSSTAPAKAGLYAKTGTRKPTTPKSAPKKSRAPHKG